jgi:3-oxoacyl-[acyl-carrier protein] reductase
MMNVLVTGITRGLGLEVTRVLLSNGYHVYGIGRKKSEDLIKLLAHYPDHLHFLSYDLTDYNHIKKEIFENWIRSTPIHAFVNNAALSYDTLITNLNSEELMPMIYVNQISPMIITKYVIRNMILHEIKGSLVHISSISAHTGFKGLSMYASTKGAIEVFSKNIAREWGVKGIRSNCIAAGYMETDMTSSLSDEDKRKIFKRVSLKEATDMKSVVDSIIYLITPSSKSMTGQVLHVDGGAV